ncbi:hypothetical protein AVEN_178669-1 [Araneus ventricosus]|uniref:Uncharacterized protein n=1 Tax=Araneus ventricosus TaxID=182803 RepID=A0A4Y2IAK7_ARAVE|nr:hypothetical protein AVEN_178669-1 [Araneus ventricosus]
MIRGSLSEVILISCHGNTKNRCCSTVFRSGSTILVEYPVNAQHQRRKSRRTETSVQFLWTVVNSVRVVRTVRLVGFRAVVPNPKV